MMLEAVWRQLEAGESEDRTTTEETGGGGSREKRAEAVNLGNQCRQKSH